MFDVHNNHIGTVNHFPVSDLKCGFIMCCRRLLANFNFIVIIKE